MVNVGAIGRGIVEIRSLVRPFSWWGNFLKANFDEFSLLELYPVCGSFLKLFSWIWDFIFWTLSFIILILSMFDRFYEAIFDFAMNYNDFPSSLWSSFLKLYYLYVCCEIFCSFLSSFMKSICLDIFRAGSLEECILFVKVPNVDKFWGNFSIAFF